MTAGMLANLNSLATIGYLQPGNLLLIVLDNESYGSTGARPHLQRGWTWPASQPDAGSRPGKDR